MNGDVILLVLLVWVVYVAVWYYLGKKRRQRNNMIRMFEKEFKYWQEKCVHESCYLCTADECPLSGDDDNDNQE